MMRPIGQSARWALRLASPIRRSAGYGPPSGCSRIARRRSSCQAIYCLSKCSRHGRALPVTAQQGPGFERRREQSQIQAFDREQPVLSMMPGMPERRTHSSVRHGTTSLFAALDVASGVVIGKCYKRHWTTEFPDFLKQIDANVPRDLDVHISWIIYAPTKPRWSGRGWRAGLTPMSTSRLPRHP